MSGDWVVLLLHVLPLAAGAAVSPVVLGAGVEILLAFGARGARMLLSYLLGSAIVVGATCTLGYVLPKPPATGSGSLIADVVAIVLGALLLVLALVLALRRPKNKTDGRAQRLLSSRWAGVGVLGLGIAMTVTNFSTLILVLAGAHEVFSAAVGPVARGLGIALLALGALTPILLPLLWVVMRPAAAARELQRLGPFITKHGRMLGVAVCVIAGGYLLARGFGLI